MDLKFSDIEFDGYIFDCDGTLVDSMPYHFQTWNALLKDLNVPYAFDWEHFISQGGKSLTKSVEEINKKLGIEIDAQFFVQEQGKRYEALIPTIKPIISIVDFAKKQFSKGKKIAVASSGSRNHVELSLKTIGVLDMFDVICCREDVKKVKPSPDLFLLAAEKLCVKPERCIVFEDSPLGVYAASAAGMVSYFVPSSQSNN